MLDTFVHRVLRFPYQLSYTVYQSPKKPRATLVLLHGLGGSSLMWDKMAKGLPSDLRIVAIDLLGFGTSPRPHWVTYNARTQARSVSATLATISLRGPVILVGHSLGALVSVEVAKRYPWMVRELILCSPPFYMPTPAEQRKRPSGDEILRSFYTSLGKNPDQAMKVLGLAGRLGIINPGFKVDASNIDAYMSTLEMAIINQTSFGDAIKSRKPISILTGRFDIVVIAGNVKRLVQRNRRVTWRQVAAGHEIKGLYRSALRREILLSYHRVTTSRSVKLPRPPRSKSR